MNKTPQKEDKGGFSQIPNILFHGYPDLSMQDRYAVMALVSVCWEEKFYPLSLRKIAELTRINHTALRSRGGEHPREGVLDRLKRLGLLDFKDDRGNEGRIQTFICIRYGNIWRENASFKKLPSLTTSTQSLVTVDTVNTSVDGASSNVPPNTSNTIHTDKTIEDREKGTLSEEPYKPELPTLSGFATATPTAPAVVVEVSHSQEKQTLSQEKSAEKKTTRPAADYTQTPLLAPEAKKPANKKASAQQMDERAQTLKDAWASLSDVKSSVQFGARSIEIAIDLYQPLSEMAAKLNMTLAEALRDIKAHAFKTDPVYYRSKGFQFWNVAQVWEGWKETKNAEIEARKRRDEIIAKAKQAQEGPQLAIPTAEQWEMMKWSNFRGRSEARKRAAAQ